MESVEEPSADKNKDEMPLGVKLIETFHETKLSYKSYQGIVLVVTFLAYTTYHLARKAPSIVKSALDPSSSTEVTGLNAVIPWGRNHLCVGGGNSMSTSSSGWAPFNGSDGSQLLGYLDVAFLSMYAGGQFLSGSLGDRLNLRVFLTIGMVGTGVFTACYGFAYWLNIHSFYYFLVVQMLAGLFQSTGWPSVVAVVGKWFGKSKRGLIMGVWNAHTSVGNITGSLIASNLLQYGWGWSMLVPGLIIASMGVVVYFTLPVNPLSLGLHVEEDDPKPDMYDDLTKPLVTPEAEEADGVEVDQQETAIGFLEAWKIPGVATYAFCLFFAKLVAYTFLYWLPFYISYTEIGGEYLSSEAAGYLSTLFDIGGVAGGVLAGLISDLIDARAITAASFTYVAIPALYCYRIYGSISIVVNGALMFIAGIFVNGPYALITTAVSADLGRHSSLRGHSRALATVTAIIDGTGSVGAAIGPLLTGYISGTSWTAVFTMLMVSAFLAGILLSKQVFAEVAAKIEGSRSRRGFNGELLV